MKMKVRIMKMKVRTMRGEKSLTFIEQTKSSRSEGELFNAAHFFVASSLKASPFIALD
jgi:hypothetical protein